MAIAVAANAALLWRAGELMSDRRLLAHQSETAGLYRSMFTDDIMSPYFRFARYDLLQPEIVVVGESRVLQFRQESFNRPFANMAMTHDLSQLPRIAEALVERPNRLKLAILSIDFWQLAEQKRPYKIERRWNPRSRWAFEWENIRRNFSELSAQYVAGAARLLRHRQVTFDQIRTVLCRCDTGGANNNIGIAAMIDGAGIDAAGSYHYTDVFSLASKRPGFSPTLQLIAEKRGIFTPAESISPVRLQLLAQARKTLIDSGVKVVTIIPPMAPMVAQAMEVSGQYRIVEDMRQTLARDFRPVLDLHDSRKISSTDCEFYDALHGGDVTYLRVLARMAEDGDADLQPVTDLGQVRDGIRRFSGRVMSYVVPRSGDRSRRELDFLGLGCAK